MTTVHDRSSRIPAWAIGNNVAALPLAAVGPLDPVVAGAAKALSSVSVVATSVRLPRFRPARGDDAAWGASAG